MAKLTPAPHPNDERYLTQDTVEDWPYEDARFYHRLKPNVRVRVKRPEFDCAFMSVVTQVVQGRQLDIIFLHHLYAVNLETGEPLPGLALRESTLMVGCRDDLWITQPEYEVFPL